MGNLSKLITGYYTVNGVIYHDKVSALRATPPGQYPEWHFITDSFRDRDWQQEPPGTLLDWYRLRAEQIRQRYDRVILMYSGGVDSTVMLHSFIDNNVPIDGVFSYGSFNLPNAEKFVRNQEIYQVAIPYISALKQSGKLKCDYYLLDDTRFYDLYNDEAWSEKTQASIYSPEVGFWSQFHRDPWIQQHCEQGTTVVLRGVDKPRVVVDDDVWKLVFLDCQTVTLHNPWVKTHDNLFYDFFYWTADLPELMVKQAHEIKKFFESRESDSPEFLELFSRDGGVYNLKRYVEWIDPIIYQPYVHEQPGEPRRYFTVGKSSMQNLWNKDDAFIATAADYQKNNWRYGMQQLAKMIPSRYYHSDKVDLDAFIRNGTVGIWSSEIVIGKKSKGEKK
jgi:hypothetical protein